MKKYIKQYRIIGEFDYDGKLAYSEKMEDCGHFVYCDNGYIMISRYAEDSLRIDIGGGGKFNSITKKLEDANINILNKFEHYKEGTLIVEEKNTSKIFRICKAKRQRKTPISIINEKDNLKYFEKVMQRFNQKTDSDGSTDE